MEVNDSIRQAVLRDLLQEDRSLFLLVNASSITLTETVATVACSNRTFRTWLRKRRRRVRLQMILSRNLDKNIELVIIAPPNMKSQ